MAKKKELSKLRESFRETRIKNFKSKKSNVSMQLISLLGIERPKAEQQSKYEVDLTDLNYPLNAIGYSRFKTWLKDRDASNRKIVKHGSNMMTKA